MKPVRLLPLLAVAAICLLALKVTGLMLGEGFVFSGAAPAGAQSKSSGAPAGTQTAKAAPSSQAGKGDTAPEPGATQAAGTKPSGEASTAPQQAPQSDNPGQAARLPANADDAPGKTASQKDAAPEARGAEKDILKSLAERRKQLDQRARELQLRENLLKVAENKVSARIEKLKAIEQRIETKLKQKDEERDAEYVKLVSLYSKMKPKDAARIFDTMDVTVLADLARRMSARTVSPILAAMDPVMAKRVTMELAADKNSPMTGLESLPKISPANPG